VQSSEQDAALRVFQEVPTRAGAELRPWCWAYHLPNKKYQWKAANSQTEIVTIEINVIASAQWDRTFLQFRGNGVWQRTTQWTMWTLCSMDKWGYCWF